MIKSVMRRLLLFGTTLVGAVFLLTIWTARDPTDVAFYLSQLCLFLGALALGTMLITDGAGLISPFKKERVLDGMVIGFSGFIGFVGPGLSSFGMITIFLSSVLLALLVVRWMRYAYPNHDFPEPDTTGAIWLVGAGIAYLFWRLPEGNLVRDAFLIPALFFLSAYLSGFLAARLSNPLKRFRKA